MSNELIAEAEKLIAGIEECVEPHRMITVLDLLNITKRLTTALKEVEEKLRPHRCSCAECGCISCYADFANRAEAHSHQRKESNREI